MANDLSKFDDDESELVPAAGANESDATISPKEFDDLFKSDPAWSAQVTVALKEPGQAIKGMYAGKGPVIELAPDKNGEIKFINTWLIQVHPQLTAALMGSHQVDRELTALPVGDFVAIQYRGQKNTRGGQRVNQYLVLKRRNPERKEIKEIAATSSDTRPTA